MPPKPKPKKKIRSGIGGEDDLFHYNNTVELTFNNKKSKYFEEKSSSDEESKVRWFKPEIECSVIDSSSSDEEEELCTPPKRLDGGEDKVEDVTLVNRAVTPPPDILAPDLTEFQGSRLKLTSDFGAKIKSLQAVTQQDQSPLTNAQWSDVVLVDQNVSPSLADRRFTLRIRTSNGVKRFTGLMSDTFDKVISQLATIHSVPVESISLSFTDQKGNFQLLKGCDSPISVHLGFADIIECHIVHASPNKDSVIEDDNENVVNIRIQGSQPNSTKQYKVFKNEPLGTIMQQYADFCKITLAKIKFYFDGEMIKSTQTPENLDMDEENMVEAQLS